MNLIYYIIFSIIFFIIGWTSTEGKKSQYVRLIDVFLYGPILIYTSTLIHNKFLKIMILFIGITTIVYNLKNYIKEKENSSNYKIYNTL